MTARSFCVKHIIFDLGGVLRGLNNFKKFIEYLHKRCWPKCPDPKWLNKLLLNLEKGRSKIKDVHDSLRVQCGFSDDYAVFVRRFAALVRPVPLPGRIELIEKLSSNYQIHLLSNTNEVHFGLLDRKKGMFTKFRRFFVSFRMGLMKPDRKIYDKVTKLLKSRPDEIMFVDDTEANIKAAKEYGWRVLKATRNRSFRSRLLRSLRIS